MRIAILMIVFAHDRLQLAFDPALYHVEDLALVVRGDRRGA
jgi:hypothetical protein